MLKPGLITFFNAGVQMFISEFIIVKHGSDLKNALSLFFHLKEWQI